MHRHQRKALGKKMISEQKMPRSPTTAQHRIEKEVPALPLPRTTPGTPVLLKDTDGRAIDIASASITTAESAELPATNFF